MGVGKRPPAGDGILALPETEAMVTPNTNSSNHNRQLSQLSPSASQVRPEHVSVFAATWGRKAPTHAPKASRLTM